MYGGMCTGNYTQSCIQLQRLCDQRGIDIYFGYLYNESLVQRGRNTLVKKFLDTDATHLFWCDADIEFKAIDVLNLILTDKDIIGGMYTKKTINWTSIRKALLAKPNMSDAEVQAFAGDFVFDAFPNVGFTIYEPTQVKHIGTGFLSIKREVIEKMIEQFPQIKYTDNGETKYTIFDCGIKDDEYLSEDYWFCDKARTLNYQIYALPSVELNHVGTYKYTGSISSMNITLKS